MTDDGPFRRRRDGMMTVHLRDAEVELLRQLAGELIELLGAPSADDPVVARLFPRAYLDPTEEDAERHWQALVGPDLLRSRLDALGDLVAALDAATGGGDHTELTLDDDDVGLWLRVLNDARLALGTRLSIGEDDDLVAGPVEPRDPRDTRDVSDERDVPDAFARRVYDWLTSLEAELVEVLLGEVPEGGAD